MVDRILRRRDRRTGLVYPAINGPRGSILLSGASLAWVHSLANLGIAPIALPTGLRWLDARMPLSVYGGLWLFAAVVATIGATTRRGQQRDDWDAWGFGAVFTMLSLWALTYLVGGVYSIFVLNEATGQIVYAYVYWAFAWQLLESLRLVNPSTEVS